MNTNKIISKIFTALKISAVAAIIILGLTYATRNPEPVEAATTAVQTVKNGWVRYDNGTHRYYKNGKMYTGWHWMTSKEGEKIDHWSYFGNDGIIRTGWKRMGTKEHPDGNHPQHWSYFGPNGWLRTGWQRMGTQNNPDENHPQHWSYFGPNGWLREGLQEMSTSTNPDGNHPKHKSYFGSNGWLVENKTFTVNSVTYSSDARGWCTQIASTPIKQNTAAVKTNTVSTVKKTDVVNKNGKWVYTVNGTPDYTYTGFAKNASGWWYIEKGIVTFKKNDIIQGTVNGVNAWWHIVNSKVTFDTTVANNAHGWWYVKNGKVDFSYTGFAKNSSGWWYIEKGNVTFKRNSVTHGTVNGITGWWNVKGSNVKFNTSVENNEHGWWYIKNGKVDFNYTGIARNEHGTWYIENGNVTFKKNDIVLATIDGVTAWYHVKNSNVTKSNTVANNVHGWWYIKNGKVDFSYTGFAKNEHGWWYIEKGNVTFKKNGVIHGTVNGITGWWNVKGSNVKFNTSVEQNEHGWWYIKDGKVDFNYTGFAKNSSGWWYIEKGNVTFKKNGNIKGTVDGKTSTWVVKDSKVTGEYKAPATNTNNTTTNNNTNKTTTNTTTNTTNTTNNTSNTSTGKIKIGGKTTSTTTNTTTNTTNNNTNKTNTTTNTTNNNTNKTTTNTNTTTTTNNNNNKPSTTPNTNNNTNTTTNTNKTTPTHTHAYTTPIYKTVHHNEKIDDSKYETNVVTYAGMAVYMFSHDAHGMGQKDTIIQHYNNNDESEQAYTYVTGETYPNGTPIHAGLISGITIDPATGKSVKDEKGNYKYPKLWIAPSFNYKLYLNDCPNGAGMWTDYGTCIVAYKPQKVTYRKITPAYDEKILTGHKCSCGAVKDTTHVSQTKAPAVQTKTIIKDYNILWYHQYPNDFKTFVEANPEFKKHASLTTTSQSDEFPGPENTNIYNYYKTYPYMKDYKGYGPDSYLKTHSGEAALNANKTIH